jgi:hypothetical protein
LGLVDFSKCETNIYFLDGRSNLYRSISYGIHSRKKIKQTPQKHWRRGGALKVMREKNSSKIRE